MMEPQMQLPIIISFRLNALTVIFKVWFISLIPTLHGQVGKVAVDSSLALVQLTILSMIRMECSPKM
jgi:hypothetical protein